MGLRLNYVISDLNKRRKLRLYMSVIGRRNLDSNEVYSTFATYNWNRSHSKILPQIRKHSIVDGVSDVIWDKNLSGMRGMPF